MGLDVHGAPPLSLSLATAGRGSPDDGLDPHKHLLRKRDGHTDSDGRRSIEVDHVHVYVINARVCVCVCNCLATQVL